MKWFKNPTTLEELKKQYKQLALKYHPDRNGNTSSMQEINNEYDLLFARLKNIHTTAEGKTYTSSTETTETSDEFKNIINSLINLIGSSVNIELIGSWIWVSGNTKEHKEILKNLKFRYAHKKQAWYYHTEPYRKKSKRELTLDEIRDMFGSQKYQPKAEKELALQ